MSDPQQHHFHIPVMGLAFTIDTPVRVAHFGIDSAISIVEDQLLENMREVLCRDHELSYENIREDAADSRARRITAYLDLVHRLVQERTRNLKKQAFGPGSDIDKYFELMPCHSPARKAYLEMQHAQGDKKIELQDELRSQIKAGAIDVNIMTKVDKTNYDHSGVPLPAEYNDALAALRGFANSTLTSSVIFSAGLNPRLYSYCAMFPDFLPGANGETKKKIILKVSDFRSALVQGKFLAKKGLWVSEFRIESGLNCGGHAFATDGLLLGPILEEFKQNRHALTAELRQLYSEALLQRGMRPSATPEFTLVVQGGVGTADEHEFLLSNYQLSSVGWGSPFLLVPEATSVDEGTVRDLSVAKPEDYYLSHASPLGVPFNNFRKSSSEAQRKRRIEKNRPGSPCYKKFLSFDTEFTERPICTASRQYQNLKIAQINADLTIKNKKEAIDAVTEKDCLCEGLGASALLVNKAKLSHKLSAVTICPGPNLAYFSGIFSLKQMVDHIYGRAHLLNSVPRPHVFINELRLYLDHFTEQVRKSSHEMTSRRIADFETFRSNLLSGIRYYRQLLSTNSKLHSMRQEMEEQLEEFRLRLQEMIIGLKPAASV